jgi:hypothetical protein
MNSLIINKDSGSNRTLNKVHQKHSVLKNSYSNLDNLKETKKSDKQKFDNRLKKKFFEVGQMNLINYTVLPTEMLNKKKQNKMLENRPNKSPVITIGQTLTTTSIIKSLKSASPTNQNTHSDDFLKLYNNSDLKYPCIVAPNANMPYRPKTRSIEAKTNFSGTTEITSVSSMEYVAPVLNKINSSPNPKIIEASKKNSSMSMSNSNSSKPSSSIGRKSASSTYENNINNNIFNFNDSSYNSFGLNNIDDLTNSIENYIQIHQIKKPDNYQNNKLIRSTSNLTASSIIDLKNGVNSKYYYYLNNNNSIAQDIINNSSHNQSKKAISHFDNKKVFKFLNSHEEKNNESTEQLRPISSKANLNLLLKNKLKDESTIKKQTENTNESENENAPSSSDISEKILNNIESINISKSINSILIKKNNLKSEVLAQQKKLKNTIIPIPPNRDIINKIYKAYNKNARNFDTAHLDNILANELKMPTLPNRNTPKTDSAKEKGTLNSIDLNSMHSFSTYNELIQRYKQEKEKQDNDKNETNRSIENEKLNEKLNEKNNSNLGKEDEKINLFDNMNPSEFEKFINSTTTSLADKLECREEKEMNKKIQIEKISFIPIIKSKSISTKDNLKKKYFQGLIKDSHNDNYDFIESNDLIDASLLTTISKKRVSFHEKVIETEIESGNTSIKPIINS